MRCLFLIAAFLLAPHGGATLRAEASGDVLPATFELDPLPPAGSASGAESPKDPGELPPPPLWIPPLSNSASILELLEKDRRAEALPLLTEALENPSRLPSDQLFRSLVLLQERCAKATGEDLEHLIRSLRVAPAAPSSRRLIEGMIRVHPASSTALDLGAGRALLTSVAEAPEDFPANHYARYFLGRSLSEEDPHAASRALRPLVLSKRATSAPELAGVASLLQGSCLVRAKQDLEATQVLRRGRKRFGRVRLEPEGLLEPYFYHALANIHEQREKFSLAMQEYRLLTSAYPDYPALEAARRDRDALARKLEEEEGSRE